MSSIMLSKSRYLNGLQCPKLLWIATNEPERIPEADAATQHIFDQGHLVGELAKKLFLGGIDVPSGDFMGNIALTKQLLQKRKPLFEAGILSGKIYSRVDILNPVNEDEWDIIEVKSSTSVKEVNLHDVSFQQLCLENSGLKIRKCFLAYINNQYVRNEDINPNELFTLQDISDEVDAAGEDIRDRIAQMLAVIGAPACPEMSIGPHCSDPYDCALTECWDGLPEHNIFTLYYGGKKCHELYSSGVLDIAGIPAGYKLNDKQRIQHDCVVSGTPYIDKEGVREFLSGLEYPLYYLDFETFGTAIPLFDDIRPYQNVPFQFSLHVQESPSGDVKHFSFLAEGKQDPRPELLKSLSRVIGDSGSIVAYNKSFEERVLLDSGKAFPEYAGWTEKVVSKLVDLIVPFRSFYYYHPSQKGSASLKNVLPAITGKGYEEMPISKGDDASLAFLSITFEDMAAEEVARIREELLAYCALDTEGMVRIIKRLEELAR
ncbi:MAG: DUF2779 domain-containing protein [Dehalococcoidales bacterium]